MSTDTSQDSQTVNAVVTAAARAAAALVPATVELLPGTPVSDPDLMLLHVILDTVCAVLVDRV